VQLASADGAPLGVAIDEPRGHGVIAFLPGDTVVAFTDGLIERRDEDITDGQDRLAHAVPRMAGRDMSTAIHDLVEEVRDPSRDDDVAVVGLRRKP
jgi:serine phosphatase RsbU (regulator of sigma subunit)